MGSRGYKLSCRVLFGARVRGADTEVAVCRVQGVIRTASCSMLISPLNAALRDQIDCEASQPMTAFIVLAGDRGKPSATMLFGHGEDDGKASVLFLQAGSDAFEHPCTTEVQAIEMR